MEAAEPGPPTARFRAMGSEVVIVVDGDPALLARAHERIDELERLWSRFLPASDVGHMNVTPGWVNVSDETIELVERSVVAFEVTGGRFNPLVLPSLIAHGYAESREGDHRITRIGFDAVVAPAPAASSIDCDRDAARVRLPDHAAFDPGGIGKGLAADLVAEELVTRGADAALVSIGGDLRVAGDAPEGWVVAVEDPWVPEVGVGDIALSRGAVCTSSVLSRRWRHEDRDVHHLIDPTTGWPMETSLITVTVVAAEAWYAEALCKAAIGLDAIPALGLLEAHEVAGLVIDADRVVWKTPGLARFAA